MSFFDREFGLQGDLPATSIGTYIDMREKRLVDMLLMPRPGERLLDVGCGTGNHLAFFRGLGCQVTGIDPSPARLEAVRHQLGESIDLRLGGAEDLPFSDNEFDIVTLITWREGIGDPARALSEAIRVCRGKVFLVALNRYSFSGIYRRTADLPSASAGDCRHFYSIRELRELIRRAIGPVPIVWGSILYLPGSCYSFARGIEESLPILNNPFGAFLGLSFSVVYRYRTVQDIIKDAYKLRVEGRREVQSTVRVIEKEDSYSLRSLSQGSSSS